MHHAARRGVFQIHTQVHFGFRRRVPPIAKHSAVKLHFHQHGGAQFALVQVGRGNPQSVGPDQGGKVAFGSDDKVFFGRQTAELDDLLFDFLL